MTAVAGGMPSCSSTADGGGGAAGGGTGAAAGAGGGAMPARAASAYFITGASSATTTDQGIGVFATAGMLANNAESLSIVSIKSSSSTTIFCTMVVLSLVRDDMSLASITICL